jgi:uncharacterized protein (TIGR02594 family)
MLPNWMVYAFDELGQAEIPGPADNLRITEYFTATAFGPADDDVPWCSAFVSWVLEKSGYASPRSAWARSYLTWGQGQTIPQIGAICVLSREGGGGHVGFVLDRDPTAGRVYLLSGNTANCVCIRSFDSAHVLGYRWPLSPV